MQIDTGRRQRAVSLPQSQVGRHGSGARSSSRDRAGSRSGSRLPSLSQSQRMAGDPSSQATAYLLAPSGPQEGADWNDALQTVIRRIDTLERISRQHGQTIATTEALSTKLDARTDHVFNHGKQFEDTLTTKLDRTFPHSNVKRIGDLFAACEFN